MTAPRPRLFGLPLPAAAAPHVERWSQQWQQLSARERLGLGAAAGSLALLALITLGISPALTTLRQAPALRQQLSQQLLQMEQQASEAQALRQLPVIAPDQAQQALKAATEFLGGGSAVDLQGSRARVVLHEVQGEALRRYVAEIRSSARARVIEAQLQRGPRGYNGHLILLTGDNP